VIIDFWALYYYNIYLTSKYLKVKFGSRQTNISSLYELVNRNVTIENNENKYEENKIKMILDVN